MSEVIVEAKETLKGFIRSFAYKGHMIRLVRWELSPDGLAYFGKWETQVMPEHSSFKEWSVLWAPLEENSISANQEYLDRSKMVGFQWQGWHAQEDSGVKFGRFKYRGENRLIPPLRWEVVWAPTEQLFHEATEANIKKQIDAQEFDSDAWYEKNIGPLAGIRCRDARTLKIVDPPEFLYQAFGMPDNGMGGPLDKQ